MTSRFLKLTHYIINTQHIKYIKVAPTKLEIHIGTDYDGFIIVGTGGFNGFPVLFNIEENTVDYDIVKKWIDKVE